MTLKDGSSWKKFWEHEKDSEIAGNKKELKLIQLVYYESNVWTQLDVSFNCILLNANKFQLKPENLLQ